MGFSTSGPVIPFTSDISYDTAKEKIIPVLGNALPVVGEQRVARGRDGERVLYSIGAVIDPG